MDIDGKINALTSNLLIVDVCVLDDLIEIHVVDSCLEPLTASLGGVHSLAGVEGLPVLEGS